MLVLLVAAKVKIKRAGFVRRDAIGKPTGPVCCHHGYRSIHAASHRRTREHSDLSVAYPRPAGVGEHAANQGGLAERDRQLVYEGFANNGAWTLLPWRRRPGLHFFLRAMLRFTAHAEMRLTSADSSPCGSGPDACGTAFGDAVP